MLKFAVCPHDTEFGGYLNRWTELARDLGKYLGKEVSVITFKDFLEERERLEKEDYDLYFANPLISYMLHKEGYKPVVSDGGDCLALISKGEEVKDNPVLSTIYLENHIIPLLYVKDIDLLKISISHRQSQKEVYEDVISGRADLGLIYESTLKKLGRELHSRRVGMCLPHFLMVKEEIYQEVSKFFKDRKDFIILESGDLDKELRISFPMDSVLNIKKFFDILRVTYENPYIGVVIYRDTIKYANSTLLAMLGYTKEEITKLKPWDIVADEHKDQVKKIVQKRIKGEYFHFLFKEMKLKTKLGSTRYVLTFSNTAFLDNKYSGFVSFVDITREVRYRKLYSALRNINKAVASVITEEDLYKTICKTLTEELDIAFAWIGVPDEKRETFKVVYKHGEENGYLKSIKIATGEKYPEGKGPTGSAYREGKIFINPDTRSNPLMEPWREEMLKRNFLSSASIPIKHNGRVVAVLNLYSREPYYFEEEMKELLSEISRDMSFALDRVEKQRDSLVLKKAIEKSDEFVIITDENGVIEYANDYVSQLTGYSKEEIIGSTPRMFKSEYHEREFYKELWDTILRGDEFNAIFINRKKDGSLFYLDEKIIPVNLPEGKKFIGLGRDVTREITLSEELERLRFHDVVTGLYNMAGFSFKATDILQKDPDHIYALVLIDIFNLTYINTTYGTQRGDLILKMVGDLLRNRFREEDIIGRTGSDEFAVFLRLKRKEDALLIEKDIENLFRDPFRVEDINIKVNINGGISIYPNDAKDFSTLYQHASLALSEAKKSGAGEIRFYDPEIEAKARDFVRAESLIDRAVKEDLFTFYCQPYFYTESLEIAGLETLVRIKEKDGKIHSPAEFIHNLERSPHLKDFEKWALEEVVRLIEKWSIPVSLNLSPKSFRREDFMDALKSVASVWSSFITIEITERALVEDIEKTKEILSRLKFHGSGLKVAVDDFGTGYSSLAYLGELPIDVVKIDISFTKAIVEDKKKRSIVEGIVHIARSLGMKTIAEGVETQAHLDVLRDIGCDMVQGYYLAKPMPEEEMDKLLS